MTLEKWSLLDLIKFGRCCTYPLEKSKRRELCYSLNTLSVSIESKEMQ